jgi:hypothetical protein
VGFFRRFLDRFTESDEGRLASSVQTWSESIPGTVRIAESPSRTPVKLAGTVKRISLVPGEHHASLEALLTDGTGEVVAVWIGRRSIPGLQLGTRIVVKGVLSKAPSPRRMVNPSYEFATGRP